MNSIFKRKKLSIIIFISSLLIIFRLLLPFVVKVYINYQLEKDFLYYGHVNDVSLNFLTGSYKVFDLNIEERNKSKNLPFLFAKEIRIGIKWKELIHLRVLAKIKIIQPEINIVHDTKNDFKKRDKNKKIEEEDSFKIWQRIVKKLIPIKLEKLSLKNGKFRFYDPHAQPMVHFYLDQIQAEGHNFTNSLELSKTLFGKIDIVCEVMKSGHLEMQAFLNPLDPVFKMKLDTKLSKLDLIELNPYFNTFGQFDVKKGKFSLYSEIIIQDKKIKGYFKPLIEDLKVSYFPVDKKKGVLHAVWEKLIGTTAGILKNHPHNLQAAKIPVSGEINDIHIDGWSTLISILDNVFIQAIQHELENSVHLNDIRKK